MTAETIHALLLAESARVALPEAFHRDVTVHDLRELQETETQEFIWVLRTCGSHLIRLDKLQPSERVPTFRAITPSHWLECISGLGDPKMLYYHFTGHHLRPVTLEHARRITSGLPPTTVWL